MFLLLVSSALAYGTGKTGSSTSGCGACHGATASAATGVAFSTADTTVAPGERIDVRLVVSHASLGYAGLDVSATGGTLGAGANTKISAGEVTHPSKQALAGGSLSFAFTWTAPAAEGTYTLRGAGNAVNGNASGSGDAWNLASDLTLVVDDGCDDTDGDGYEACDDGSGDDCDDADATVYPGAAERCDGVDEDCDGTADDSPSIGGTSYWADVDADGYGAGAATASCSALAGFVTNRSDCDDADATVSPVGVESCDGEDDDCDGTVDEDAATDAATWYADADADGYGDPATVTAACSLPAGFVGDATDCDDTRAGTNPGAAEVCDALDLDEDCDGASDDADAGVGGTSAWYLDGDGDGFGDGGVLADACAAPADFVAVDGDCDDTDAAYNPGAVEDCADPTDYNCDGVTGFADTDGDGAAACDDCDDTDAAAFPGASERCNAVDDDCDGAVDEDDAVDAATWYVDADADGWGSAAATTAACAQPEGYDDDALDCDDARAEVRPDAPEAWYDGVDQDCDGRDDDQDGDGVPVGEDCDDTDALLTACEGDTGDTGDTGTPDDTGDTGDTGTPDDTGDTGTPGDTGDTADTGTPGDTGTPADTGATPDTDAAPAAPDAPGCGGCASSGGGAALGLAAAALLAAATRRRRP